MPPTPTPQTIHEPTRHIRVAREVDVCVLGGSCTGVFAAIRAARLGCRVALIEKAGAFGGVATLSMVNVWHSPLDTVYQKTLFAGLTTETIARLDRRKAVTHRPNNPHWAWAFNPWELQIELDEMIRDCPTITPMLHTLLAAPYVHDGKLAGVIVEDKSGRSAVLAKVLIDATGDGDLCHRLGVPTYQAHHLQPSTTCCMLEGAKESLQQILPRVVREHGHEVGLPEGFMWGAFLPGSSIYMLAGTRIYNQDCSDAQQLTAAEIEGRRQVRAMLDLLRKYAPEHAVSLQALPARIGIRQTRHVKCLHQLTGDEVLYGHRFDDAIANGSYRVDVHHQDKPGITFKYLDGTEEYNRPGGGGHKGRWRDPLPEGQADPTFYQIPWRSMLPQGPFDNLVAAGRMIDADSQAHAAIRVMVNMNQTGEAAGVAAALSLDRNEPVNALPVQAIRAALASGGSVVI